MRSRSRAVVIAAIAALLTAHLSSGVAHAEVVDPDPTPQAKCGDGSIPEPGLQGRMSRAELDDLNHAGYRCNVHVVGQFGPDDNGIAGAGGYKVHRYIDPNGTECAYYDTTLLFPLSVAAQTTNLSGVHVLDMTNPAAPVKTANLLTPAMQSPHESFSFVEAPNPLPGPLNTGRNRALLAAVAGTPATAPGIVDIYDVTDDCTTPLLMASLPTGLLGHEGNFSPDGRTFWASATATSNLTAIDVTVPSAPVIIWRGPYAFHGLTVSDDGNTLYAADLRSGKRGVAVLDVTQVQARVPNAVVTEIGHLSWDTVTIPQQPMPFTRDGKQYLAEVDEFTRNNITGAARIIEVQEGVNSEGERTVDLEVVSDLRLEVNQQEHRDTLSNDPGFGNSLSDYSAHYCALPSRTDPAIIACSFVLSGLRVFDITKPDKPKEIAYFNPSFGDSTSYAMSAPAFAPERCEVWYSDGNKGFWNVRITNDMWEGCGS